VSDFVCATSFKDKREMLKAFKHRFNDGTDIALCFECVKKAIREKRIGPGAFYRGMRQGDPNIKNALNEFAKKLNAWAIEIGGETGRSSGTAASSFGGSPCKRLNMYLRWMVRKDDGIDLGIWRDVRRHSLSFLSTRMWPPSRGAIN